jgi:hypothetical protein
MAVDDVMGTWRGRTRLRGGDLERAWGEFLGRLPWQYFVTLTFRNEVNLDLASKEAYRWLCLVGYLCRRPIVWAYAIEISRNQMPHVHAVIEGAGDPNLKTLAATWQMRNGHADIARVYDARRVALYSTKQAARGDVVLSDTLTPTRLKTAASITVPLVRDKAYAD